MRMKNATNKLKNKRDIIRQNERAAARKPLLVETADNYEERLDEKLHLQERHRVNDERRKGTAIKLTRIFLVACSIYLAFLIFGVINTEYVRDEKGNVVPLVMSYQQIKQLEDFNKLAVQYRQARMLYEHVLVLDYRIAAGIEDAMSIAPEYEKLLTSVEPLAIQLSALTLPAEFTQTKNMLLTWTKNDIAIYCQNISRAVSQNNEEYATRALEYKSLMYQDFSVITSNLMSLGAKVDGASLGDIAEWSPEKYVQDTLGVFGGG